ncbi:hypothetical protein HC776_03530 [bacterium]|nr:hypothetical protein [bacterium]
MSSPRSALRAAITSLTLSNNSGDANAEWVIQGERTLILNGFDTAAANLVKPYTINAISLNVTRPVGDAPVTVVVYEDPNGGSPVDAKLIARTDVVLSSAGTARVVLPQPPSTQSQIFWAGFYLPVNFGFNSDTAGTSVLTYWAWTPGAEFDLNNLGSASVFGPPTAQHPSILISQASPVSAPKSRRRLLRPLVSRRLLRHWVARLWAMPAPVSRRWCLTPNAAPCSMTATM